jgi:tRNA A-37 threonylcarbamoyl transferase component Bud32
MLNQQVMSETLKCPRCGTALPAKAPEGLCPRCLAALNFATETVVAGDEAAPHTPPTPAELAPHFPQLEILEYLGRGGMGVVYKARQKSLNRVTALKLLAPERVADARFAERFAREAQALAQLSHPNIVTIYDFGQAGGFYFLLMEFVDGVNLRQLLQERKLQPPEALAIVPPICEALQYAHEHGIVHRDIKPENLLLDKSGRAKIADFGIAKMLGTPASQTGVAETQVVGTPQYMAPEQRLEPQAADHRADIYSLGVVLYELLTGELPAEKLQPPSRKVLIDVRLDEIVLRALQKTPDLRYQTAAEFRTQVETVMSDAGPLPRGAGESLRMLKVGTSTATTPERLGTLAGQLFHYRTKGHLILDERQLTFTRAGNTTVVPLSAIRDLSIGRYPGIMNPAGINFISVTWGNGAETKRLFFLPNEGLFGWPSQVNQFVEEWFEAMRAATIAATGRAPATTPAGELGVPTRSIAMLAIFAALIVPGGVMAILLARGGDGKLGWPAVLLLGIFAVGLLSPFALGLLGRTRRANGSRTGLQGVPRVVAIVLGVLLGFIGMVGLVTALWVGAYTSLQVPRNQAEAQQASAELNRARIELAKMKALYGPGDPRVAAQVKKVAELERHVPRPAAPVMITESNLTVPNGSLNLIGPDGEPVTSPEILRIRLEEAERELARASKLHAEKLVSDQEMDLARSKVELRKAELASDVQQVARVHLERAEKEFRHASELRKQNLISESEFNKARTELELRGAVVKSFGDGQLKTNRSQ